jgi:hypothetical protein
MNDYKKRVLNIMKRKLIKMMIWVIMAWLREKKKVMVRLIKINVKVKVKN